MQQGKIDVPGGHLYYERDGAGAPLVFIHGFTLDTRMWDEQFSAFAPTHTVVRYDLRGFGQSAVPTQAGYSHTEDLRQLLDHLDIDRTTLIGLSKGGGVALDFALTWPGRVQALALIDSVLAGFPWSEAQRQHDDVPWQAAKLGGIPAAKAAWLAHPIFAPALQHAAVATALRRIIDDYSGWHFIHADPEVRMEPRAAARLGELHCPVLVLAGDLDLPDFVAIAGVIAREVLHVQHVLLEGVGHMANMEAPARVNAELAQFLWESR
jgi:pimeloyl-ACP methyl ester carboxylesterase